MSPSRRRRTGLLPGAGGVGLRPGSRSAASATRTHPVRRHDAAGSQFDHEISVQRHRLTMRDEQNRAPTSQLAQTRRHRPLALGVEV